MCNNIQKQGSSLETLTGVRGHKQQAREEELAAMKLLCPHLEEMFPKRTFLAKLRDPGDEAGR